MYDINKSYMLYESFLFVFLGKQFEYSYFIFCFYSFVTHSNVSLPHIYTYIKYIRFPVISCLTGYFAGHCLFLFCMFRLVFP